MNHAAETTPTPRTKERLLAAACRIFSRQGFGATRVAEICAEAHCNIASVNYHFGGKEKLYQEALIHLAQVLDAAHPYQPQPDETAEAAFCRYIRISVDRVFTATEGNLHLLIMHEFSEPTPSGQEVLLPLLQERRALLQNLLKNLAPQADAVALEGVHFAVVSQLVFLAQFGDQLQAWTEPQGDLAAWARLKAKQICEIALAGLARLQSASGSTP